MTRREPGFTPDHDTAHLRDRRAALHPHLAAAATGEPIAALEQQAPEDANIMEAAQAQARV